MVVPDDGMTVDVLFRCLVVIAAGVLWLVGLRLFLGTTLSGRRKMTWTACLLGTGGAIGVLLTGPQVWQRFLILFLLVPVLGVIDIALLRARRGLSFWIRACGFEVGTVFGMAAGTRLLCDAVGFVAVLGRR